MGEDSGQPIPRAPFKKAVANYCSCEVLSIRPNTTYNGKATPLQAWTGPEGSSRLRLPDFKTIGT